MKKLAIMFVMLLGSVATIQAQSNTTFDFSCITAAEQQAIDDAAAEAAAAAEVAAEAASELALGFDRNQAPLFQAGEPEALIADGFIQGGGDSDEGRVIDVNHYAIPIVTSGICPRCQYGTRVAIDVYDDGYVVSTGLDTEVDETPYSSFADALVFANAEVARLNDPNGNGFDNQEEAILSEASFVPQSGTLVFSRDYANTDHGDGTFSYTPVRIHAVNGGFQAQGEDGFPDTTRDTLAELIAFLDAFDFYSL